MRKGFLVTISTILLLLTVLLFTKSNQQMLGDDGRKIIDAQAIDSAAYAFDDIASDLSSLLGPTPTISRNSSASNISFIEQLPRSGDAALLSNYGSFISNYSNITNSQVSVNFSSILNGSLLVFSNGLAYDRNSSAVRFYSSGKSTNVSRYDLSIFSNAHRTSENLSSMPQSGGLKLVINYTDLDGSIAASGAVDPASVASFLVTYDSNSQGSLLISAGNLSGSSGSMSIQQGGSAQVAFNLTAEGAWSGIAYGYNANISYSQLNVSRAGVAWVKED